MAKNLLAGQEQALGSGRYRGEGNDLPTPEFLPGEFYEQRNLAGATLSGLTKSRHG